MLKLILSIFTSTLLLIYCTNNKTSQQAKIFIQNPDTIYAIKDSTYTIGYDTTKGLISGQDIISCTLLDDIITNTNYSCLETTYNKSVKNDITIEYKSFIDFLELNSNSRYVDMFYYTDGNKNLNLAFEHNGDTKTYKIDQKILKEMTPAEIKSIMHMEPCTQTNYSYFHTQKVLKELNISNAHTLVLNFVVYKEISGYNDVDKLKSQAGKLSVVCRVKDSNGKILQCRDLNITCPPTCSHQL